jgi:hypothetical protein
MKNKKIWIVSRTKMTLEEFREKAKDEEWTPGWDAVESVFKELYGEQDPAHVSHNQVMSNVR